MPRKRSTNMSNVLINGQHLIDIADAIRAKNGTEETYKISEMAQAIEDIPSGGFSIEDFFNHTYYDEKNIVFNNVKSLFPYCFYNNTTLESFSSDSVTSLSTYSGGAGSYVFAKCSNLKSVSIPNIKGTGSGGHQFDSCISLTDVYMPSASIGQYMFSGCKSLVNIALPHIGNAVGMNNYGFQNCTSLEKVDLGTTKLANGEFSGCVKLTTLILRRENGICTNGNSNNFNNTPFASGGAGGEIYIPKVLYDHLGDGTALDYKSASKWTTIDGYGTITWKQIEGSQYEHYYADGTPITEE